jgi:hypothetical protein
VPAVVDDKVVVAQREDPAVGRKHGGPQLAQGSLQHYLRTSPVEFYNATSNGVVSDTDSTRS